LKLTVNVYQQLHYQALIKFLIADYDLRPIMCWKYRRCQKIWWVVKSM